MEIKEFNYDNREDYFQIVRKYKIHRDGVFVSRKNGH